MEQDAAVKRARFIQSSVETREVFHWAAPADVIKAAKVFCGSLLGLPSVDQDLHGAAAALLWSDLCQGGHTGQICQLLPQLEDENEQKKKDEEACAYHFNVNRGLQRTIVHR